MAILKKDFPNKISTGLWSDKDFNIFYYDFRIDNNRIRGTLDYSSKNWNLAMKTTVAKAHIEKLKNEKIELLSNDQIKLNLFVENYFKPQTKTDWIKTKINHYEKYIKNFIGNKKIKSITKSDIQAIISRQYELELKPRTIKTTLEVLNPIFKKAVEKEIIIKNPCNGLKIELEHKEVVIQNPHQKLQEIYDVLYNEFHDDPYYLSLYLFALQGRTKSEILSLKWEFIDFGNNRYRLKEDGRWYFLQDNVETQLLKFRRKYGWVYESSHNIGRPISNIEKQTNKIKKSIPKFTIRYMQDVVKEIQEQQSIESFVDHRMLESNIEFKQDKIVEVVDNEDKKDKLQSNSEKVLKPLKIKPKLSIGKFNKKT